MIRINDPTAEIRPLPRKPVRERPVGIDQGMELPGGFFEPLPEALLDAFEGTDASG